VRGGINVVVVEHTNNVHDNNIIVARLYTYYIVLEKNLNKHKKQSHKRIIAFLSVVPTIIIIIIMINKPSTTIAVHQNPLGR